MSVNVLVSFKHADAVVKRNPQGRSRRGWVIEQVEQTQVGVQKCLRLHSLENGRGLKPYYSIC